MAEGEQEIAFSGWGDNKARGIYVMKARGTRVRLLFESLEPSEGDFNPYWSPDGRRLVSVVDGQGPWIVGADGSGARRLARLEIDGYSGPIAWSPDGRTLAFGSAGDGALYTIHTDGTGLRPLTRKGTSDQSGEAAAMVGSAAWSPDGRRIVFARGLPYSDRPSQIEVVAASGRGERRVAAG
jgi:Tol biopolymer transport system component